MKETFTCTVFLLLGIITCYSQDPIDVSEQTIKVGGFKEEELLFGFAAGDKIVFAFQEANNKELKEIEIIEYPNNSKFSDYKTSKVEKTFAVTKQGVYIFRFKNSALGGRVCKIKIQRIPISTATVNFNTTVNWINKQDTAWNTFTKDVIIGYDSTYVQKSKKVLVKVDTIVTPLFDKMLRVHSETAMGKSQYTYADVELPNNTVYPSQFNPYKSTEVIAWSYWLGVGQKSQEEYDRANKSLAAGVKAIGVLTGYGALASLAVSGISLFGTPAVGDNVRFRFYGIQNGNEINIDYGNVISASARNDRFTQGSFRVELYNDNFRDGIDVNLKMVALQVSKVWEDKTFTELKVTPRIEKQLFKEPVVTSSRVAIAGL
jgi:hypothetical protein